MATQVLLIDDDRELGEMLSDYLAPEQLELTVCGSGEDGLRELDRNPFDLLILDIMLPGMNGLEVLKELRTANDVPVIMLTARGDDVDKILGLEFGADDYIAKPFNPRELTARIKAILRRAGPGDTHTDKYAVGDIELDMRTRRVVAMDQELRLTGTEYEVLRCLLQSPGDVVSRERMSKEALGRKLLPYDRSIDTHISNLRGKLEDAGVSNPAIINKRGVGYRLVPEE